MAQRWAPKGDSSTQKLTGEVSLNNLSGLEGYCAMKSGAGWIIASSTDRAAVIMNGGNGSAAQITLCVGGKGQIRMGGTCSAGDALIAEGSGAGLASVADNGSIVGYAAQTCSASGQIIDYRATYGDRY